MGILHRALFIDRDGTINKDCPYCSDPDDLVLYEDTVRLIKQYKNNGYLVIVITNQSGIARGYFTEDQLRKFNGKMVDELAKRGAEIDDIYYCPHHPDDKCDCRKPNTGMVKRAVKDHDILLSQSIMVGDRDDTDGQLARNLGIHFRQVKYS